MINNAYKHFVKDDLSESGTEVSCYNNMPTYHVLS